ncbi:hypothetical protein [Dactylosporangium sp. CA-139066]|uniref:hypothetical protein n=1 Tax=Dactylosporangium sp. CA-139066 TaxID=3239930 RepID=UPI003D8AC148
MEDAEIWRGDPHNTPDGALWVPSQCGECKAVVGTPHRDGCSGQHFESVVTVDGARRGWA